MRFTHLVASLGILLSSPSFASLQWISDGGNAAHTNSLPITTTPENYHLIWEQQLFDYRDWEMTYINDYLIADNKCFYSITMYDQNYHTHYRLMTIDMESGKTLWSIDQPHAIALSHHEGKILLDSSPKTEKTIQAYDVKSGQIIYTVSMPTNLSNLLPYESNMYFSMGRDSIGSFDAKNARLNWTAALAPGKTFASGLAVNQEYLVARQFDGLRVFQRSNGKELYKLWIPDVFYEAINFPAPTVNDNTAYMILLDDETKKSYHYQATLYAINLSQHSVKWSLPKQLPKQSLVLTKHFIFSIAKDNETIQAVNVITGKIEWSWTPPSDDRLDETRIVATADTLFVAAKHRIYAVSFATHQSVWQLDRAAEQLALGENTLFIISRDFLKNIHLAAIALN